MYYLIALSTENVVHHAPEIAFDRAMPLSPAWMLVYGSIWVFMLLPFLVVRQDELIFRTLLSYIAVVTISYGGFLLYPTSAPRPDELPQDGFFAWTLAFNYRFDPPYNCFPSLHVAWASVTSLTAFRVHRGVGIAAAIWTTLIGISTIYTKQHYAVDVVGGFLAAGVAYLVFLRTHRKGSIPAVDRSRAPIRAAWVVWIYAGVVAGYWIAYTAGGS
jgi:membrane-associated phospholipid phosphatase